ncbi:MULTISPECIES: hypothetical protein [unclassified Bradyrhizobium]|uniref:hypothetical protein n=1 Tax=unclassified Bradyrhizobium TaxID=2631580 RepID=UPI0033930A7C
MSTTKALLQSLAKGIENVLTNVAGKKVAFALIVWEERDDPVLPTQANYVSNCLRPDVAKALKDMLARWEKGQGDVAKQD